MAMLYGYDAQDRQDRYLEIAHAAVSLAAEASLPGAALVNVFPFCTSSLPTPWLPHKLTLLCMI